MFHIGTIISKDNQKSKHMEQLITLDHHLYELCGNSALSKANELDALIIEENSMGGLKPTCELILELRKNFSVLIWIISEELVAMNKIVYLQLGADGVVDNDQDKETSMIQLSNLLMRFKKEKEKGKQQLVKSSNLKIIPHNLSLQIGTQEIGLTRLEFQTVSYLMEHGSKAVTYEEIYQNVWQDEFNHKDEENRQYRVSNLIFHLRKKIEADPANPVYIKTVRSKGYMLMA